MKFARKVSGEYSSPTDKELLSEVNAFRIQGEMDKNKQQLRQVQEQLKEMTGAVKAPENEHKAEAPAVVPPMSK